MGMRLTVPEVHLSRCQDLNRGSGFCSQIDARRQHKPKYAPNLDEPIDNLLLPHLPRPLKMEPDLKLRMGLRSQRTKSRDHREIIGRINLENEAVRVSG